MSETEVLPTPKVRGLRTPQSALRALKKVIEGREDYVYPLRGGGCFYVHDTPAGKVPGCLIGHLLVDAGVPIEWLAWRESVGDDNSAHAVADDLSLSPAVGSLLMTAQDCQDSGGAWSRAVALAAEHVS